MKILKTLLIVFWCTTCFGQNFDQPMLDSLFQILEGKNQMMGNLAIIQDGKKVYTRSFGYSSIETRSRANAHTKYRLGSISKTYTAALIFKLIEEDKLSLETTLSQFFPELPNADSITIQNLLNHHSGLANLTDRQDYLSWNTQLKSREELFDLIKESGTDFEPGQRGEYSNTNYILLSFIAEEIEKKTFDKVLKKLIVEPLNLKNTQFGRNIRTKNNEALSYSYKGKKWELSTQTDMSIPMGAGGIIADAQETALFFYHLFEGGLIDQHSLEQMKEVNDGYGSGLFKSVFKDKESYGHTGGIDGFRSSAFYFPEEKTSVALLSNATRTELKGIMETALAIYFGYEYQLPDFEPLRNAADFIGLYEGEKFPLAIEITADEYSLYGQATGQSAFKLDQKSDTTFAFPSADIQIEFLRKENQLKITQHGSTHTLTKQVLEKIENPEKYTGVYSADGFPMELKIFTKDQMLYGQASGQSAFRLTKTDGDSFEFEPAGLVIEFSPEENQLNLTQQGHTFILEKIE